MNRLEIHIGQWYDSQPATIKKSLIRQFYHLYCDPSDGDLRTRVNAAIDSLAIDYTKAIEAISPRQDAFKLMLSNKTEYKEFMESLGA
jgi:uncharacterized UBP type Zn finger protein